MSTESFTAETATEPETDLPTVIGEFVDAINAGSADGVRRCFTEKAVVNDGGREIRGREAIARWADEEFFQAAGTIRPSRVQPISQLGGDQVVTAHLHGTHRSGMSTLLVTATPAAIAVLQLRR
ncbi:YybH family protein [Streptomyces sp. NBC_01477]|uniref:YybH family protein n=1 Tax=Streptomyces sp. NBC_01477 TaxID=2976015 RepID=UPI002E3672C6|nr:nuclear transport factor 2 family protein [Streptomyces sp. NBC_01477]